MSPEERAKGAYLNPDHIRAKLPSIDLKLQVKIKLKERDLTMRHLSLLMRRNPGYIQNALGKKDVEMSFLIALCNHLQTNLLEYYLPFISTPDIRKTAAEKLLEKQLAEKQQEIAALEKERDIYKAIVLK